MQVRWNRVLIGVGIAATAGVAACHYVLPDGYAVNVPIRSVIGGGIGAPDAEEFARITAPPGFQVDLYTDGIRNARILRPTGTGDLLVSSPATGRIWLVERDDDGDGRADGQRELLTDLHRPHGLALKNGWLYVAETDAVGRIRFDAEQRRTRGDFERLIRDLPDGGQHWTRTLRFGPDGWLYVSVGSNCNVCEETNPKRAALLRYRPDGSDAQIYATGLRNSVGFDWRPGTGELFATDNGRDMLGDDIPPCELNRIVESGFYGWPYVNGDNVPDPDFGSKRPDLLATAIPPAHDFRAHNAPLGISFLRGTALPASLRGAALVALHGSWNRAKKDGYKVVSLHWGSDGEIQERDFLVGFEIDGDVIGRPVDVVEDLDGSIYVSDDYAGAIYRIRWHEES